MAVDVEVGALADGGHRFPEFKGLRSRERAVAIVACGGVISLQLVTQQASGLVLQQIAFLAEAGRMPGERSTKQSKEADDRCLCRRVQQGLRGCS